jgi:hypothetical protein
MKNTITEDKKWKILSSEYLVQRPWLTARRDVAEDIDVFILEQDYVRELLQNNQILQALMAAPLWKYFYDKDV